jgi:hypothetical protein
MATNVFSLVQDENFTNLPETEKAKVLETLLPQDKSFMALPEEEKIKVLNSLVSSKPPAITSAQSAIEETNSSPNYSFDPDTVAIAGLGGALVNSLPGMGVGGLAARAAKGALTGGLSGASGELVRTETNNSDAGKLYAFGAELATGALPNLVGDALGRTAVPAIAATLSMFGKGGYQMAKTLKEGIGRSESDILARNAIFGRRTVKEGVATDVFSKEVRDKWVEEMASKYGIKTTSAENAATPVRNKIYEHIESIGPLKNSPEMIELKSRLAEGVRVGAVKPDDYKAITNLLESQVSKDPKYSKEFTERFVNTIQQATPEWNGVKISDPAAQVTREALDKVLARGRVPTYSELKNIETEQFVAKARDSIPVLLNQQFKGEAVENAMANIAKSPQGQQDFRVALASYLKNLPEKEALSEFNRLYSTVAKTKALPTEELLRMKRAVAKFVEKGYIAKAGDITGTALRNSIVRGVLPAEFADLATVPDEQKVPALL